MKPRYATHQLNPKSRDEDVTCQTLNSQLVTMIRIMIEY